jgi:hypothetical protein
MRLRLIGGTLFVTLMMAACQGGPPPTVFVMEVTREVTRMVTIVGTPGPLVTKEAVTQEATTEALPAETLTASATPTLSPTPAVTATSDVFPTPVVGQIYVAEQSFENGKMFWLQPVQQIWVATTDENGDNIWQVYDDTFVDGQPETNPTLTPPAGLIQPERGFGKLWRETPEVLAMLGWAKDAEYGYVTRYEYRAGGSVNERNEYVPGVGRHLVTMLDGQVIEFNEADRTWTILDSPSSN